MKISREELYRRVWETPVRTLAKEFDISDVGLAKVCRKNNIPLPPLGYWMKVQHGKTVKTPALPTSEIKEVIFDAKTHRFQTPSAPEMKALATEVIELDFKAPSKAMNLAPVAAYTLKSLQAAKADARGLVSCVGPNGFDCTVSPAQVSRATRLLHAVEIALLPLGATISAGTSRAHAVAEYEGTTVRFRVHETYTRSETKVTTGKYEWSYHKTYQYQLSGRLTFEIEEWFDGQKRWSDTSRQTIEEKLGGFILSLVDAAKAIIQRKFEWAEQDRLREEAKHQREEVARRLKEEQEFRQQLLDEATLWQKCEVARQYLAQVRERSAATKQPLPHRSLEWLTRAELALAGMHPLEKRLFQADFAEDVAPAVDGEGHDNDNFEDREF